MTSHIHLVSGAKSFIPMGGSGFECDTLPRIPQEVDQCGAVIFKMTEGETSLSKRLIIQHKKAPMPEAEETDIVMQPADEGFIDFRLILDKEKYYHIRLEPSSSKQVELPATEKDLVEWNISADKLARLARTEWNHCQLSAMPQWKDVLIMRALDLATNHV